jgi:hypothetical protein
MSWIRRRMRIGWHPMCSQRRCRTCWLSYGKLDLHPI